MWIRAVELGGVDMMEFRKISEVKWALVNYLDVRSEKEGQVKADSRCQLPAEMRNIGVHEGTDHVCFTHHCTPVPKTVCPTHYRYFSEQKTFKIIDCRVSSKPLKYVTPVYFGVTNTVFSGFWERWVAPLNHSSDIIESLLATEWFWKDISA